MSLQTYLLKSENTCLLFLTSRVQLLTGTSEEISFEQMEDGSFCLKSTNALSSVKLRVTYNPWYELAPKEISPPIGKTSECFMEVEVDTRLPAKPPPSHAKSGTSDLLNAIKNFPGLEYLQKQ